MASDPCEVMEFLIAQESSLVQAGVDDEVFIDAYAIAEAEQQRSRLGDRLKEALGCLVHVHLPGENLRGVISDVGAEVLVLESEQTRLAVAISSVLGIEGLPRVLRAEHTNSPRVSVTWAVVLREWSQVAPVRFSLVDGRQVRASVDAVAGDHLDIHPDHGNSIVLPLSAIRYAEVSR